MLALIPSLAQPQRKFPFLRTLILGLFFLSCDLSERPLFPPRCRIKIYAIAASPCCVHAQHKNSIHRLGSLPTFTARAPMSELAVIAQECRSSVNIPVDFRCTWMISLLSDSSHATGHDAADRRFDFIREVASGGWPDRIALGDPTASCCSDAFRTGCHRLQRQTGRPLFWCPLFRNPPPACRLPCR